MACEVSAAPTGGALVASDVVVEEETLELIVENDLRRNTVNREFIILHGNDPAKLLPPLPQNERPRSSVSGVWDCNNPAMRQLGNLQRRGPRQHLPGSAGVRRPALISPELRRPQTAYTRHVCQLIGTPYDSRRPHTSQGKMESMEFRQRPEVRPSAVGPEELLQPKRVLLDLGQCEQLEPEPLLHTPAGGMRRPGRYKNSARRPTSSKSGSTYIPAMDKQHLEDFHKLLRGDMEFLPPDKPTTVRIILAGTKHDFLKEREALHHEVLPNLREYCEHLGLELEVIDLGLDLGQVPDVEFNLNQLKEARSYSLGPFYVHFSGDYCPGPVPPPEMPVGDFEGIRKMTADLKVENRHLLDLFYTKDENALPPRYVFQHEHSDCKDDMHTFINLWQNLVVIAEHAQKFNTEKRMRFETKTGTEHDLDSLFHGLKPNAAKMVGLQCMSFCRRFKDIRATDESKSEATEAHYINSKEETSFSFEFNPEKRIDKNQDILKRCLPVENFSTYEIPWTGAGVEEENEEHMQYLESFTEDFKATLKTLISRNHDQWVIKHRYRHMYPELLEHLKHFKASSSAFAGRQKEIEFVTSYLKDSERCKLPLVIHGARGVGKSALMCAIAKNSKDSIGKSCVCVLRSMGLTFASSDLTQLLVGLCVQICNIYNMDSPPESDFDSVNKMAAHFKNTLELVAKHHAARKPLLLLLDGIEQLETHDRADTLFWLPQSLPRHVFLVVSMKGNLLLDRATVRYGPNSLLELGNFDTSELQVIVEAILRANGRQLPQNHVDILLQVLSNNTHPLFVHTLALQAMRWKSEADVSPESLPKSIPECMNHLANKLENRFGAKFVQKLMAYICLLPIGMSEKELHDLLCSDQEVLQYIVQQHQLESGAMESAFDIILQRLLRFENEMQGYLVRTSENGRHLFKWACTTYRDILSKKYFGATNPFTGKNDNMDDTIKKMTHLFTTEKPFKIKLKITRNDMQSFHEIKCETMPYNLGPQNGRKLQVLPNLIALSGSEQEYSKQLKDSCLCNFAWLLAKLQCLSCKPVMNDFNQVSEKDNEIDTLRFFLQIAKANLALDPMSLAAQLLGCMPFLDDDYPLLNQMIVDCQTWIDNFEGQVLVPAFPFFPSCIDLCRQKVWNIVDIMQIETSQRLAVLRNETGYIEIWDIENYELVHALGVRYDRVTPNVFCNPTQVIGINGADLAVWEIESGIVQSSVDLEKLLGEAITSMYVFCVSHNFEKVAIHLSDEDFNQSLNFIHTPTEKLLYKLAHFDVKDEFYKSSAVFTEMGDYMVFVMARSVVMDEKKSADLVKLLVFSLETMNVEHTISCGERKFNKLILKDDSMAIVSWNDCSFDVYDIASGGHYCTLNAPDPRLTIEHCMLTIDNCLVGLSRSQNDVERKYYALWFWNIEEKSSVNLLSQTFEQPDEVPKKFIIIEELRLAVLSLSNIGSFSLWDLPNSECIFTSKAHIGTIDNVFKTKDPYQIYTSSNSEEVLKLWDFYEIIRKAKEDKVQKSRGRARSNPKLSSVPSNQTTKSILNRDQARPKSRKSKKELCKSKSVRFADDESIFSEDVKSTKSEIDAVSVTTGNNDARAAEVIGGSGRDEDVMATQLDSMLGATGVSFSHDGSLIILATDRHLPTMLELTNYHVIKRLEPLDDHDVATPWAELVCEDKLVVGLTLDEHSRDVWPIVYKYHVWDLSSREPMHRDQELLSNVTTCRVSQDRTRVVLCCLDAQTSEKLAEITFKVLDIRKHDLLQEARYTTPAIPTALQLMDDVSYAVANHIVQQGEQSHGFTVYHLEVPDSKALLEPAPYEYKKGTKHKVYRATQNAILPGGQLSLSTGLNGDIQVWDITSREYEGNLSDDPHVKDTRNPNLHNHSNKRIMDMVISEDGAYLVCAGANGSTSVWDMENDVNVFSYGGHSSEIVKCTISRDNQLIVTAGSDQILNVWKFGVTERPLCRLYVHCLVTCLHMSSTNKHVALVGSRRNEPSRFMLFQTTNAPQPVEKNNR